MSKFARLSFVVLILAGITVWIGTLGYMFVQTRAPLVNPSPVIFGVLLVANFFLGITVAIILIVGLLTNTDKN
jgi:hypothetical protein